MQLLGILDERFAGSLDERVLKTTAAPIGLRASRYERRARRLERFNGLPQAPQARDAEQRSRLGFLEATLHLGDELLRLLARLEHDDAGIRTELPRSHERRGLKLLRNLHAAILQRARQNEYRIDTAHLQINRLPCRIRGRFQRQRRPPRARIAGRSNQRMRNEVSTILVVGTVDHLDGSGF